MPMNGHNNEYLISRVYLFVFFKLLFRLDLAKENIVIDIIKYPNKYNTNERNG